MDNEEIRGRDISRPMDRLELDGTEYPLAFDMTAFRVAEDVYELQYKRNANFAEITQWLGQGKMGAIMAMLYGALIGAGNEITWAQFAKSFKLDSLPGVREILEKGVKDALPQVTEEDKKDPQ